MVSNRPPVLQRAAGKTQAVLSGRSLGRGRGPDQRQSGSGDPFDPGRIVVAGRDGGFHRSNVIGFEVHHGRPESWGNSKSLDAESSLPKRIQFAP